MIKTKAKRKKLSQGRVLASFLKAFLCLNTIKWPIKCDKRAVRCMQMIRCRLSSRLNYHSWINLFDLLPVHPHPVSSHDRISLKIPMILLICANFAGQLAQVSTPWDLTTRYGSDNKQSTLRHVESRPMWRGKSNCSQSPHWLAQKIFRFNLLTNLSK